MKKRNYLTRVCGISLATILALGGVGCSGGKSSAEQRGVATSSDAAKVANVLANSVFKETQFDLSKLYNDDGLTVEVNDVKKIDGKYYLLASKGDNYELKKIVILSLDPESKEQNLVEINLDDAVNPFRDFDAEIADQEGESGGVAIEGKVVEEQEVVSDDTAITEVTDASISNEDVQEAADKFIADFVKEQGTTAQVNYTSCSLGDDGNVYALRHSTEYAEDSSSKNGLKTTNAEALRKWDINGSMISDAQLPSNDKNIYFNTITPAANGVFLYGYDQESGGYAWIRVDQDGKATEPTPVSDNMFWGYNAFVNNKGQVCSMGYDASYNSVINVFDDNMNVASTIKLPSSFQYMGGEGGITFADDETIVFSNAGALYSYHIGDEQATEIVNFVNSDLTMSALDNVFLKDNGDFYGTYMDTINHRYCFAEYNAVDPSEIVQKEVIRIAGFSNGITDTTLKKNIVEFNSNNDQYKIVFDDYSKYATDDDYMGGYTKLNNDILAGNIPDIFAVTEGLGLDTYISKGLIEDVGALMENDPDISKLEYMENVFDAYRVDGKLYNVVPSFMVVSLIGKKSILGDRTSWTMEEMQEVCNNLPENMAPFAMMNKETFLMYSLIFNQADFMDISAGECNFNTQEFIDTLEFANTFSKEIDYMNEENYMDYESRFRNDKALLCELNVYDFQSLKREINGYFGEPITIVGFPTTKGKGGVIGANESYAISAKSAHKDVAWEFLKQLLQEDYQKNIKYSLPVLKSAFDEKAKEALQDKTTYEDENGNIQEYTEMIMINGEEMELKGLTQEQLDQITNYIQTIDTSYKYDEKIFEIIEEETTPFFEGAKSAKEVADIIQNRVKLYMQENR